MEEKNYQKKLDLVVQFRQVIKVICKNNIQSYKYTQILGQIKEENESSQKEKENHKDPDFFLTENKRMQNLVQNPKQKKVSRENFFSYYFFYKDCFNAYLNSLILKEQNSKKDSHHQSLLFSIYRNINERQIKVNSINKIDIFEILKNRLNPKPTS